MAKQASPSYLKNTVYYTFIPLLRNGLAFFTLPILTRYLTLADYGTVNLLTMTMTILFSLFGLNLTETTYRYYFKYQDDLNALKAMFSTVLLTLLISVSLGMVILIVLFPLVNKSVFHGTMTLLWMSLVFTQFLFMQINAMNQYLFQNRQEGKAWVQNELAAIGIQVPLSIVLVTTTSLTFEAIILSAVAAEFVKGVILFVRLRSYYALVFEITFLKEAVAYSWPMLPNMLLSIVYTALDRTMLSTYKGVSQVGLLDLTNRITLILKTFMDGIGGTFSPITLNCLTINTKESLEKLSNLNLQVISLILFVGLGISVFTQELVLLLTTKEFHFTMYIVPIYIYSQVFVIVSHVPSWLIRFPGKTVWTIPITACVVASNVVANVLLIPKYGVIGASIAALISSAIGNFMQYVIGMRITPIPMKNTKLLTIFMVMFIETAIVYALYSLKLNFMVNILLKLSLLLVFAGLCFALKIITPIECKGYYHRFRREFGSRFDFLKPQRGSHSLI